jgi:hypothetical protein
MIGRCGLNLFIRFEVLTVVNMKNTVFLDVTPCLCNKRRFGGTYRPHHEGGISLQHASFATYC